MRPQCAAPPGRTGFIRITLSPNRDRRKRKTTKSYAIFAWLLRQKRLWPRSPKIGPYSADSCFGYLGPEKIDSRFWGILAIVYCQNQKVPITAPARDSIPFQSGDLTGLHRGFTIRPSLCNLRIKINQSRRGLCYAN
jgi:hypothetical protein